MSGNPYPVDSSGVELADVDIADTFFERLAAIEAAAAVSGGEGKIEQ